MPINCALAQLSPGRQPLLTLIWARSIRNISSRYNETPQVVTVEKCTENPVIVLSESDDVDIIGPPDAVSNLRPIIRKKLLHETKLQRQLREMQDATQLWNQEFWAAHNTNFIKQREEYIKQQTPGEERQQLSPDEMSEFYKKFLDKNWEHHLRYNIAWYKRNFELLRLALRVYIEKSVSKLR